MGEHTTPETTDLTIETLDEMLTVDKNALCGLIGIATAVVRISAYLPEIEQLVLAFSPDDEELGTLAHQFVTDFGI